MAETFSEMMPLGTVAPNFNLPDAVTGKMMTFKEMAAGRTGVVVIFMCNHCPYVKHILPQLVHIAKKFIGRGMGFVAINSNDVENYPEDAPHLMKALAKEMSFPFPYLYDETQEVAKNYQAACTPDFYLFDEEKKCIYRGRFDASTPGNKEECTGNDLATAIEDYLQGIPLNSQQFPSVGCNIKWKS